MTGSSSRNMKSQPERSCVICRKRAAKTDLLRVVCTNEGVMLVDSESKMQMRGAYIHLDKSCVARASAARIWRHVFRKPRLEEESVRKFFLQLNELIK